MAAYTTIDDPSAYFQTKLYTGNGTDDTAITNDGNSDLQPDWIWIKRRSSTEDHQLADSNRGVTKWLHSNLTNAESTTTARLKSFDTDGFTLGDTGSTNNSGDTFVAWQWKANGGTTSSNTDGSITSTVQANTDAGFSIVTWTGNGTSGATVGHGLGVKPNHIIIRNRSTASINWTNYVEEIGATKFLQLNVTNAGTTATNRFNDTEPTTSVFSLGDSSRSNGNTSDMIAYCFAEKQGYSKFGKYTGNGNANGTFVYTGFKPAFVITKASSSASSWMMYDHKRLGYNPIDVALRANGSDEEKTSLISGDDIDLLSNGFKVRNSNATINGSGTTYIYIAFAENPFVTSTGTPTTAK